MKEYVKNMKKDVENMKKYVRICGKYGGIYVKICRNMKEI